MGGPGRIAAHQHPGRIGIVAVATAPRRQRRQRLFEHGDVVKGGVGAGITGPQQSSQRLTAGDLRTIQKRQQRVMAKGLLPRRRRVLLGIGVIDDQGGVDIDMQPLPGHRAGPNLPRRRPGGRPRGTDAG